MCGAIWKVREENTALCKLGKLLTLGSGVRRGVLILVEESVWTVCKVVMLRVQVKAIAEAVLEAIAIPM